MTFEEVAEFIVKANQGEKFTITEYGAYYRDTHLEEYIVHIRRNKSLEQLLQPSRT